MGWRRHVGALAVSLFACTGDDDDAAVETSEPPVSMTETSSSSGSTASSTSTSSSGSTSTSTTTSDPSSSSGTQRYWEPRAAMPTPRSELAAAVVNGRVYVPAGFGGRSVLEIYDPQTDDWTSGASLPDGRDHAAVAAVEGIVYVVGGNEGETSLFAYDPTVDAWERRRRLPHRRTSTVALALGGSLWVVGGSADNVDEATLREVLRYDPAENEWYTEGSLTTQREHHGGVVIDRVLWLFGGRNGLASDTSMELYDTRNASSTVGPSMLAARGGFQAAIHRSTVVAHGGEQLDDAPAIVPTSEALDLDGSAWAPTLDLPVAVHGHACVVVDDVLLIIGGSDFAGGVNNAGRVWALR